MKNNIFYKFLYAILYIVTIFFGFFYLSWIIWIRFLRERIIREIPDILLTEYRFWILLYICCIYIYVIKNLIKPSSQVKFANLKLFLIILLTIIFKPLLILDKFLKYNMKTKTLYYKIMRYVIIYIFRNPSTLYNMKLGFTTFPGLFLVGILCFDTFYFHKLFYFYKFILLGISPMLFNYFEYSLYEIYDHYKEYLKKQYEQILIFQKDFEYDEMPEDKDAILHKTYMDVNAYIEMHYENYLDYYYTENITYLYIGIPMPHEAQYTQYSVEKYNDYDILMTEQDHIILKNRVEFDTIMDSLLKLKILDQMFQNLNDSIIISISKLVKCSLYLICCSYILIISTYYYCPDFLYFLKLLAILDGTKTPNPFE